MESRIWLENNVGYGQIYIPDTLSSGFYQIVAYTNWMNGDYETYRFTKELYIANRFDQEVTADFNAYINDTIIEDEFFLGGELKVNSAFSIKLGSSENVFSPRSKVLVDALFTSTNPLDSIAEVTISVVEINSLFKYENNSIRDVLSLFERNKLASEKFIDNVNIETTGVIVSGKVINSDDDSGVGNITVFLSTPDTVVNLQYADTDSFGNFKFMLSNYYEGKDLFIGLMNNKIAGDYEIIIEDKYKCNIPFSHSNYLTKAHTAFVKKSQKVSKVNKSFKIEVAQNIEKDFCSFYCPQLYSKPDIRVYSSDYVFLDRLDVMIQEMIYGVKVNRKDDYSISILDPIINKYYNNSFVFLDGVPFFEMNGIIEYGSDKIKRLEVVNSTWVLGNYLFDGILSIFTNDFEINRFKNKKNQIVIPAGKYLPRAKFLSPDHTLVQEHRTPDFRQLLYWNPQVILSRNNKTSIEFYTGDLCSKFLIKAEGITSKGVPISSSIIIDVEKK